MTKKDFIALAACLRNADTVEDAAANIAQMLGADNPRFDRKAFMTAAGWPVS